MKNLDDVLSGLPADRRQRIELRVKEILAEETASFAKPLAAAVLLKKAVNDSADECGPDCDDYAHGKSCPACDPAKWLVDQQVEIERLRSRLEMREAQMAALKVEDQPQFLQLQARLAEAERDSQRLDWLERHLFEGKWDGTIGRPKSWHMAGPYRHTLQRMRGDALREAIDLAMRADSATHRENERE